MFIQKKEPNYQPPRPILFDTIDKERVAIDPLTLFLLLVVLVDRKPEVEIENAFIMN